MGRLKSTVQAVARASAVIAAFAIFIVTAGLWIAFLPYFLLYGGLLVLLAVVGLAVANLIERLRARAQSLPGVPRA